MGVKIEAGPDEDVAPTTGPEPDDDDFDEGDGGGSTAPEPTLEPTPEPANKQPSYEELQAQLIKLQNATKRNNSELARRRHIERLMKQLGIVDFGKWLQDRGIDPVTGLPLARPSAELEPDDEGDYEGDGEGEESEETEDEGSEGEEPEETEEPEEPEDDGRGQVLEAALRRTSVKAALRELGFTGDADRALKVLEADGSLDLIEVDDDGEVIGAEDAAKSLRDEFPEWFRRQAPARTPPRRVGVDAGDRQPAPPRRSTWERQLEDRILGGGRRR